MLKLLADENFKHQIVRALRRRLPGVDVLNVLEAGIAGASDPEVLAWAAEAGRVVLTHDVRTMGAFAYQRVANGQPLLGVIEVPDLMPMAQALDDLLLIIQLAEPEEIQDRVLRLPL